MLKHVVNYTDPLTDEDVTETLYFNLSKAEVAEIVMIDPDYAEKMQETAKREDAKELIEMFRDFVRRSYGEVIEAGGKKRFTKSAEVSESFLTSEAYSTFFYDHLKDPERIFEFINGVMPQELMEAGKAQMSNRPVPQDRKPKQVKAKPVEDIELPEDVTTRRAELESKSPSEMTVDEFIELKSLQEG